MSDPFLETLAADDPVPLLHALRASDPVHHVDPLGFWVVTRHEDIKRLFHDPDHVTHDKRAWQLYEAPPKGSMRRWHEDHGIFSVAKEEHARIRRLVAAAFTPRAVRRMELQIREVIDTIVAPLTGRDGETVDLLGEFTNVVPNAVMSRITGVRSGNDETRFCRVAQAVIQGFMPFLPEDVQLEVERGFQEFSDWVREMVAQRRRYPEEDLVTDLVRAQDSDDALTEDDVVLLLAALIGAGSEATSQVATSIVRALLDEPEILELLRCDRTVITRSIDEIIRYAFTQPAGPMRFALRDFELRGKQISKGQMIMLSAGGANRDPSAYENPDVLDLNRTVHDLLTFGYGPHYCLGAHLARQELATMLDAILDVLPAGSAVCRDSLEYREMGVFRQAMNLPVRIGPAL